MAPRRYQATKRAEMADATRRRIVEATAALHAEKGIVATRIKDVAQRADVGLGTVYHHFPAYEDLVKACGAHMAVVTRPPAIEILAGVEGAERRIRVAIGEIFAYYERYPHFERARCDRDRMEILRVAVEARQQVLTSLLQEAVRPRPDGAELVPTLVALTDFAVYRALAAAGMSTSQAAERISEVALAWLGTRRAASRTGRNAP